MMGLAGVDPEFDERGGREIAGESGDRQFLRKIKAAF